MNINSLSPKYLVIQNYVQFDLNFVEDVMSLAPTDNNFCHQFSDYILETYISSTAKFRPEMWSDVPCAELKRTTNGLEFFHSHFSQQFYSAHPTIFAFVDIILKLQTATYVKIRSLDLPANTRKNDHEKIDFLLDQYRQYSCGDISLQQYVKSIGYKYAARTDM
jgi:hypothetical protein